MTIPEHLLEITENKQPGYHPLMHFENWRVAVFNQDPTRNLDTLSYVEYHGLTDEVFVLIKGKCALIVAGGSEQPDTFSTVAMESGKCYNIRKGVWHGLILEDDGVVLIVENEDTGRENSAYYTLTEDDKALIKEKVQKVLS